MSLKTLSFKCFLLCLITLISLSVSAQKTGLSHLDTLLKQLTAAKEDTNKVNLSINLGKAYSTSKKADSAFVYLQRALQLSQKLKWKDGMARSYSELGEQYYRQHDYVNEQNYFKKAVELSFNAGDYKLAFESAHSVAWAMSDQNKIPEGNSYLDSIAGQFKKTGHMREQIGIYMEIAGWYHQLSDFNAATDYFNKAMFMAKTDPDKYLTRNNILNIAYFYVDSHQSDKARALLLKAEAKYKKAGNLQDLSDIYDAFAQYDLNSHNYPAAVADYRKGAQIAEKIKYDYVSAWSENGMGWAYYLMKKYDSAYVHTKRAFPYAKNDSSLLIRPISNLGSIYREASGFIMKNAGLKPGQQYEQSVELLAQSVNFGIRHGEAEFANENLEELSKTYQKMHRYADAFKTYHSFVMRKDSLDSLKNEKVVLLKEERLNYSHKEDSLKYQQNITNTQLKQKKQQSYFFIGGIVVLLVLSLFIWLNFNNQRKSNKLLADANGQLNEQRAEITTHRDQLADTITNLKTAQTQLIQSEKMASLGELTAGIAHEIQNPLNFVNNFSEVSVELLQELKEEVKAGNTTDVLAIADDLTQNLNKIHHHGKRADGIVKGMLEHSRASTGQKEPTDLNKLADEYLRLAYHGLRAKDKTFNAELVTNFDGRLPPVNVIPQDIGRVLLNLFNNAFYATQQKKKAAGDDYKPEVTLVTSGENGLITIRVKDNGNGIPYNIKDKIMQPFFTTKPTGEGTGLGLSLSYDIVVKGHGGNISINTTGGAGAEFIISIPINS